MLDELPVSPKGWGVAVAGGLIGVTVFGLQDITASAINSVIGVVVLAMATFAFVDAYLIAKALDERESGVSA